MIKNFYQKVCIFLLLILLFIFVLSIFHFISMNQYAKTLTIVPLDSTTWLARDEDIGISYFFSMEPNQSLYFSASDSNTIKSYHFSDAPFWINQSNLESENVQRKLWVWCIKNLPDRPDEIYPIVKNPPSMGPAKDLSETLCDLAAERLNLPYRWSGHRWITIPEPQK